MTHVKRYHYDTKGDNMSLNFLPAIKQLSLEKGLPEDIVIETVESALAAAYRKDYGKSGQHIVTKIEPETGQIKIWRVYTVVEKEDLIENPLAEILPKDAKIIDKKAKVGDEVKEELPYHDEFGRIAAQTAKQVIIQRLREAERDILFNEFKDKEKQIVNGTVQQVEGRVVIVNLGKTTGVILPSGQIPGESYPIGHRIRIYVQEVEESSRGPRIILTRASTEFMSSLFAVEVPEIASGSVEIKGIAREAGARTKIAVWSDEEGIDPVGSAVGQHGSRVQAVLSEIGDEKVDIILYDKDDKSYIVNAMSPARINTVTLDKKTKLAKVDVQEDQLSLAIGRRGQNVRLASQLTGWEIDVVSTSKTIQDKTATDVDEVRPKTEKSTSNKTTNKKSTIKKIKGTKEKK